VQARDDSDYNLAIDYFTRAMQLNTDFALYLNRGNIYFDLKKPELAISDYRTALSMNPNSPDAANNLGTQLGILGQYDSALKYATQAITIQSDFKAAYSNRALIFMKMNRYEDAIRDWQKFIQFEPDAADAYNTIGSCYRAMGKFEEPLVPVNKAISMKPDPIFYICRSYSYNGLKNIEAAKRDALFAKEHGAQIPDDLAKSLGL